MQKVISEIYCLSKDIADYQTAAVREKTMVITIKLDKIVQIYHQHQDQFPPLHQHHIQPLLPINQHISLLLEQLPFIRGH